jgi:hypothetical protein
VQIMRGNARGNIKGNEGIALVTALVILLALTLMAMLMVNTSILESKTTVVTKEEKQAFFLAEAGIARVRSMFREALDNNRSNPVVVDGQTLNATAWFDGGYNGNWGQPGSIGVIQYVDNYMGGTYNTLQWRFFRKRFTDDAGAPQFVSKASHLSQYTDPANSTTWTQDADSYNDKDEPAAVTADAGSPQAFRERYGRPAFYIYEHAALNTIFSDFAEMGRVTFIGLYPPIGSEQSCEAPCNPGNRPIATVRVEVESASGFRKMIEQEIMEPPVLPITGGAQAAGTASWNGSGNIRWGQLKTKNNISVGGSGNNVPYGCSLPGVQNCIATQGTSNKCYDKWFSATADAGQTITMPGPPTATTPANCSTDCIGCDEQAYRPYLNYRLYQNKPVTLDHWDQGTVKDYAQDSNSVYTYDGTNFYRGDFSGSIPPGTPPISFGQLMDPNGQYLGKSDFAYIQMVNDSVTTVDFSTNKIPGNFAEGSLYIDGNVSFSGGGGGANIAVKNPDQFNGITGGTTDLTGVNFKGVLYATGDIGGTGTIKIFGGILAETGNLALSGNSEVWYDESLKESAGPNVPVTEKSKWREIR